MCINEKWILDPGMKKVTPPLVGDEDIVTNAVSKYGNTFYVLERFGMHTGFLCEHFAILPDQPAEVIEEPELATA